ncbi:MAG: YeiH family protein [Candidatus Humimicrobiaceae bacterium]
MTQIKKITPGILLCLAIAAPAWFLGKAFPIIGGSVFGILIGMIITMIFPKIQLKELLHRSTKSAQAACRFDDGIKYTAKKLLQYSIILLGFEMNLFNVIKVGSQSLFVMLFTLSASFLTTFFMGKALKLHGKMATLIGVGTSICGGSAIAATAPVIHAEDEDVAHAISTIFLFNIVAVFFFPALGRLFGMSDVGFGMWAGTAINDTSSVVAAGASWSSVAGNNTALAFATIVKLTRTLMIVPITLVLAIYTARKSKKTTEGSTFRFSKVFPWFVMGFVAVAVINTFAGIPAPISHSLVTIGEFIIIMAMAAIGLNTHLKKLITNGFKPIFLGLCCWFVVAGVSLLVQVMMKMW